jgi:hypothetical protein
MSVTFHELIYFILNMHQNAYNDKRLARKRIINKYDPELLEYIK